VGHVDEILSFVPDRRRNGFKVLWASPNAMKDLLTHALPHEPTAFFRGRQHKQKYLEVDVNTVLEMCRATNAALQERCLDPIQERVLQGLNLTKSALVPMPVFFANKGTKQIPVAEAFTVNCVNVQVVNGHLLVPRPHGPRLPADKARAVLKKLLHAWNSPLRPIIHEPGGFPFWYEPKDYVDLPAYYFAEGPRARIVKLLGAFLSQSDPDAAADAYARQVEEGSEGEAIARKRFDVVLCPGFSLGDLYERRNPPAKLPITRDGYLERCFRVWIREPTVDLIEVFIDTVTAPLGLKVHYIDSWSLHAAGGGVHCGSNTIRTPPSGLWWKDELQTPYPRYRET
jgi:hypothetical protein